MLLSQSQIINCRFFSLCLILVKPTSWILSSKGPQCSLGNPISFFFSDIPHPCYWLYPLVHLSDEGLLLALAPCCTGGNVWPGAMEALASPQHGIWWGPALTIELSWGCPQALWDIPYTRAWGVGSDLWRPPHPHTPNQSLLQLIVPVTKSLCYNLKFPHCTFSVPSLTVSGQPPLVGLTLHL